MGQCSMFPWKIQISSMSCIRYPLSYTVYMLWILVSNRRILMLLPRVIMRDIPAIVLWLARTCVWIMRWPHSAATWSPTPGLILDELISRVGCHALHDCWLKVSTIFRETQYSEKESTTSTFSLMKAPSRARDPPNANKIVHSESLYIYKWAFKHGLFLLWN